MRDPARSGRDCPANRCIPIPSSSPASGRKLKAKPARRTSRRSAAPGRGIRQPGGGRWRRAAPGDLRSCPSLAGELSPRHRPGAPSQTTAGSATACEYKGAKAGAVEIRIQTADTAAIFAAERKTFDATRQRTADHPGFGDEAFTNVKHMPLSLPDVNTLVARQGSVEIRVSSSASIAAERTLEQQFFTKVG